MAPILLFNTGEVSGSASYTIAVTAATTAGDGVVVSVAVGGTAPPAITSVVDSAGNIYTQLQLTSSSPYIGVFRSYGDIALTTSNTITITFAAATTGGIGAVAVSTPGMRVTDVNVLATGSSTTPSVTGTPAQTGETALACFTWASAGGAGTIGGGFTQIGQGRQTGGTYATVAYVTGAGTSALTPTATITSASWRAVLLTLKPSVPWYMSLGTYIHDMYVDDATDTAFFFNTPTAFAISNSQSATGIQDSFTCTPILKYTSYAQLLADISGSAQVVGGVTFSPHTISGSFTWLMYDTEDWNDTTVEPQEEVDDPWTYMADFVTLAHAHSYKVMLAPARDLGNDPTSVNPLGGSETLDAWYIRTNIAGTAAATGAEIVHVQAQADTVPTSSFTSFWNSNLALIAAANGACQPSIGVSTTYGAASDMATAAQAVATTTWGYWLNITIATASQGAAFLALMNSGTSPVALPESGTLTDALSVSSPIALANAATVTDALVATVAGTAIPLADGGSMADAALAVAITPLADSGTVTTTWLSTAATTLADSGTLTDLLSLAGTFAIPLADGGAETDVLSGFPIPLADGGTATDYLTTLPPPVFLAPSGVIHIHRKREKLAAPSDQWFTIATELISSSSSSFYPSLAPARAPATAYIGLGNPRGDTVILEDRYAPKETTVYMTHSPAPANWEPPPPVIKVPVGKANKHSIVTRLMQSQHPAAHYTGKFHALIK